LGKATSTYFDDDELGTVTIACYELNPSVGLVHVDSKLRLSVAVPRLLAVFGWMHLSLMCRALKP
jgi:hypothetical protein